MTKIVASGKAAGILTLDTELQQQCRDIGATFIASEIDVTLFHTQRYERSAYALDSPVSFSLFASA